MAPRSLAGAALSLLIPFLLLVGVANAAGLYKAGSDVLKVTDANFEVRLAFCWWFKGGLIV